ncbi:uncharacterized protein [Henckelia pumila]|uniref:uncharacterized protein n=1 Tax=Henckelia pumila TaxID=405737 RepID=UPI003C6DE786
MMLKLGFSPIWVEKIMRCVRSVRYSFSVNGDIVGNIVPSRGLRQGDHLSPYLFVLYAHGLSSSILSIEEHRALTGVRIASSCTSITHLLFADDSLVFFKATINDCEAIRNCLIRYEKASGQLINYEKSSVSFSPNTNAAMAESIKSSLAISIMQSHEVYLGLPSISARSKSLQFRYLVERVVKRIQSWGSKNFSGVDEGKKRMHWKTWKFLCKPKGMGGLGFRQLDTFNKALLAKQIWRIIKDPDSLVARVLKARYFCHQDVMEAGLGSNPSYLWRSLLWSRPLLEKEVCWHVGDRAKIDISKDRWISKIRVRVNMIQEHDLHSKVKDLMVNGGWNTQLVQQLFPPYLAKEILAIPTFSDQQQDFRFWPLDPKGRYSVREGYKSEMGFYDSPVCHLDVLDLFLWFKQKLKKNDFEVFVMRTWATWNERLRLIHKNDSGTKGILSDWGEKLLQEFQSARTALDVGFAKSNCSSPETWAAPSENNLQMNVDAAYNENTSSFAIGRVIRNHEGQPILDFGRQIDNPQSVLFAELLAIQEGFKVAQTHNFQVNHFTSDSLLAVQAVTTPEEDLNYAGSIATDIRRLLDSRSNTNLTHIRRSANVVAHSIDAFSISSSSNFVWKIGDFPVWLIHLVTKDLLLLQ